MNPSPQNKYQNHSRRHIFSRFDKLWREELACFPKISNFDLFPRATALFQCRSPALSLIFTRFSLAQRHVPGGSARADVIKLVLRYVSSCSGPRALIEEGRCWPSQVHQQACQAGGRSDDAPAGDDGRLPAVGRAPAKTAVQARRTMARYILLPL